MAMILQIMGGVVTAQGQIQAGRAQAAAAEYNAQLAERDALIERQKAEYEEAVFRSQGEKIKKRQRALYAKAGVQMAGSPLLVLEETAAEIERNALAIRYGGELEAIGFEAEASTERFAGAQAKKASYYKAAGSLLSSAGSTWEKSETRKATSRKYK